MEKDIYYYKPDVPMFVFMDGGNLVRVRVIRYVDGNLHSILADWDYYNIQTEFYTCMDSDPFYCLIQNNDGTLTVNCDSLKGIARECGIKTEDSKEFDAWTEQVLNDAKKVGCPIFDDANDARKHVFKKSIL